MDRKEKPLTESDVLKALYHMYCAAEYKGSVTMSSQTAIGLYNFFHAQKDEINRLNETLSATIAGQETLQKHIAEKEAEIEEHKDVSMRLSVALNKANEEIERLSAYYKDEFERLRLTFTMKLESETQKRKAEAIKEYLVKLKEESFDLPHIDLLADRMVATRVVDMKTIVKVAKEMVGDE